MSTLKEILEIPKGKPRYLPRIDSYPTDIEREFSICGTRWRGREDNVNVQYERVFDLIESTPIQQCICPKCHNEVTRDKVMIDVVYRCCVEGGVTFSTRTDEYTYGWCQPCEDKFHKELERKNEKEFLEMDKTCHLDFGEKYNDTYPKLDFSTPEVRY
jgi:hypothetical protein